MADQKLKTLTLERLASFKPIANTPSLSAAPCVYFKIVGGRAEFFVMDDAGAEIQMTSGGAPR